MTAVNYQEVAGTLADLINGNANLSPAISANTFEVGASVRAIATRTGFVRVYPRGDETSGGVVALANLPTVGKITANSVAGANGSTVYNDAAPWYADPTDTTPLVGSYHIQLVPAVTDTVNASSPQILTVEPTAIVVVATNA